MHTPEHIRLHEAENGKSWKKFGPYLSERQWGTVREDYSEFGGAWEFFSHDHARSRVYRWGEDGIAGISDDKQLLCFASTFWNEKDPILKERLFGLTGNEGNHSEDVKELYYYLDSTPTHSYMKYLYRYPIQEFPYGKLVNENARRNNSEPEFEILDTGVFNDNQYFDCFIEYAKASEEDIYIRISVQNCSSEKAKLHVLPTIWLRNTWLRKNESVKSNLQNIENQDFSQIKLYQEDLGEYFLSANEKCDVLFTENETNAPKLFGLSNNSNFYKDGFHEYLVHKNSKAINKIGIGTKAAFHFELELKAKSEKIIFLRLSRSVNKFDLATAQSVFENRLKEADLFYDFVQKGISENNQKIHRQALAGMMWGKQFYYFDLDKWLNGDKGQYPPPEIRKKGRNSAWKELKCNDIISMPDKWEYPWFAAWDTAFHVIPIAHIDPIFAKNQMLLLLSERYMNSRGQIPAYEWAFGDLNPPVIAYGCWKIFQIEKQNSNLDLAFINTVFNRLELNYNWWQQNQKHTQKNTYKGGFLGLDNVSVIDRGAPIPNGGWINQIDGTAWMALFALNMMQMSLELGNEDKAINYLTHFLEISSDFNVEFWNAEKEIFNENIEFPNGNKLTIPIENIVSLMCLYPTEIISKLVLDKNPKFGNALFDLRKNYPDFIHELGMGEVLLVATSKSRLNRVIDRIFDKNIFFAPFGIRSLSKEYDAHPLYFDLCGNWHKIQYKPEESDTNNFGENSNWRGPVWFPVNYVLVDALYKLSHLMPQVKLQTDSLVANLVSIFSVPENNHDGKILFYEYFNPETGKGCGASHQTGWTGLVADLLHSSF
jgi:hypothetical protein